MSDKNEEILVEKVRELQKTEVNRSSNTALVFNEKSERSQPMSEAEVRKAMFARSRRGFLVGGIAALAGVFGWRWMPDETKNSLIQKSFRWNEKLSQTFFEETDLAPEFPRELAGARVNGMIGLGEEFDSSAWRLQVTGLPEAQRFPQYSAAMMFPGDNAPRSLDSPPKPDVAVPGLQLSLNDIKSLPRVEMTTELKCIEGWVQIVNWTGVRFSDFASQFFSGLALGQRPDLHNLPVEMTKYVSLVTPDRSYFVGWDIQSILHPQTLLAYEMNGEPLKPEHGAPLRLVTTTKYGIKQLKRIGRIEFTNERPQDYWADFGYDWYSGH